jgi:hypothetical protein
MSAKSVWSGPKMSREEFSREVPQILENDQELQFNGIETEDKSWFRYLIQSDSMFVSSRETVTRKIRPNISAKETMLTVFFPSRNVLGLDALPKRQKYNHDCIAQNVIPELQCEISQFARP